MSSWSETCEIVWKQCEHWTAGVGHGGGEGATTITSGEDNNIFDDISGSDWDAPGKEYRKVFITAASGELTKPMVWIEQDTPTYQDYIRIRLTGTLSHQLADPAAKTQGTGEIILQYTLIGETATCYAVDGDGTHFLSEFQIGERAYYKNAHTETLTNLDITEIVSDTHMHITPVERNISGDEGIEWGSIWIGSLDSYDTYIPSTSATALQGHPLSPGNPVGVVIERNFIAGAREGYKENNFVIRVESGD